MSYAIEQILSQLNTKSATESSAPNAPTFKQLLSHFDVLDRGDWFDELLVNQDAFEKELRYRIYEFRNIVHNNAVLYWETQEAFDSDDVVDLAKEVQRCLQAIADACGYNEEFVIRLDVVCRFGHQDGKASRIIVVNSNKQWHSSTKSSKQDFARALGTYLSNRTAIKKHNGSFDVMLTDIDGAKQVFNSHYLQDYLNYDSTHTAHDPEVVWINFIADGGCDPEEVMFDIGDEVSQYIGRLKSYEFPMFIGITYADRQSNNKGQYQTREFFTLTDFIEDGEFYDWYEHQ